MFVLLVFSTVYGLANLDLFFKLSAILNFGAAADIITGLIILLMFISPILIHLYSFGGKEKLLVISAYASYMWVAFLIIYFPAAIIIEIYNFIVQSGLFNKVMNFMIVSPFQTFFVPFIFSVAINIYGYFEAQNLQVERLTVKTAKLPRGVDKVTVAQISDLHLGIIVKDKTLGRVIKAVESFEPDIIVSTGDLVDGVVRYINHYADRLKKLQARYGKFAVTGNHEAYGGLKQALKFTEDSGFTILRGEAVTVEGILNIAGVDDLADVKKKRGGDVMTEREILDGLPRELFTLLLKHRADVDRGSLSLFDLQLSGHTHKGQMFPVSLFTMFIFKHHSGYTKLPKGSDLYISRGAGTGGPPVRLLSKPEIAIIDIVSEKSSTMV